MASGDIIKKSSEIRPLIIEYAETFGVECSREERVRMRKEADNISDYDPAGRFAHLMYATMLAAGDKSMDDTEVYMYFTTSLGSVMDGSEDAYEAFLETVRDVADEDMGQVSTVKLKIVEKNTTFENRVLSQIRSSFLDSDIFKSIIEGIANELQTTMLQGVATDKKKYGAMIESIHRRLGFIASSGDFISSETGTLIIDKVESDAPMDDLERAESIIKQFSNDIGPLMGILEKLKEMFEDSGMDVEIPEFDVSDLENKMREEILDNSGVLAQSFVLIRRSTMYLTAMYTLIGTGRLGGDGNKRLAYALRDCLKNAVEDAARASENVLKLKKATTPENAISLN